MTATAEADASTGFQVSGGQTAASLAPWEVMAWIACFQSNKYLNFPTIDFLDYLPKNEHITWTLMVGRWICLEKWCFFKGTVNFRGGNSVIQLDLTSTLQRDEGAQS